MLSRIAAKRRLQDTKELRAVADDREQALAMAKRANAAPVCDHSASVSLLVSAAL